MCACVCVCVSSSARELVRERERGGERESVREGASAERESPPSRLLPSLLLAERGFLEVRRVGVREHERLGDARLVGCGICAAAGLQHVVHRVRIGSPARMHVCPNPSRLRMERRG